MYSVTVRGHFMIAHSFNGESFGPAQRLHGATYVVDVTLYRQSLGDDDIVVGIDQLQGMVATKLDELNLTNLDEDSALAGRNTSTEFMAGHIFERLEHAIQNGRAGQAAQNCCRMRVTLGESHIAWASYENDL